MFAFLKTLPLIALLSSGAIAAEKKIDLFFPSYQAELSGKLIKNTLGSLDLVLTPVNAKTGETIAIESVEFDAQMPEHQHGMLTTAKVKKLKDGAYQIQGVKLHMSGLWELIVKVNYKNGSYEKNTVSYQLE